MLGGSWGNTFQLYFALSHKKRAAKSLTFEIFAIDCRQEIGEGACMDDGAVFSCNGKHLLEIKEAFFFLCLQNMFSHRSVSLI